MEKHTHENLENGDKGALTASMYIKDDHLYIDFGKELSWLSLHKENVRLLIDLLEKKYKEL